MEHDELQKIIDRLESANSKDEAYFGIYRYGGPGEEFIKANKQGLELFAADILKAAQDTDKNLLDKQKPVCSLSYDADWVDEDSEVFLQYVDPLAGTRAQALQPPDTEETFEDKMFRGGCLTAIIISIISAIVGLITIISWLNSFL